MKQLAKSFLQFYRRTGFTLMGADVGEGCLLQRGATVYRGTHNGAPGIIKLHDGVTLSCGALLNAWGGSISIADDVFIGPYTVIYGHGGVEIGKDSLIAEHCSILSANHAVPGRNQTIRSQPDERMKTVIGSDVWIGAGARILGGVEIGDGCVIGAGAVVTKSLPAYSVAVGVPATVIRTRE